MVKIQAELNDIFIIQVNKLKLRANDKEVEKIYEGIKELPTLTKYRDNVIHYNGRVDRIR